MTAHRAALIECADLAVTLSGRTIFADITLRIGSGETLVIQGVSGTGKTTLLRTLAGLIPPAAGSLTRRITRQGVLFQESRLLPWLSVDRNVRLGMPDRSVWSRRPNPAVAALLAELGLGDVLEDPPRRLSGGMQRRVALARALAAEPEIIFADEPFANLDQRSADVVAARLGAAVRAGTALVITAHEHHDRLRALGPHRCVALR